MLIDIEENIMDKVMLQQSYRGVVIDNNDPKKLGRVKVQIDGLLEGSSDKLPWISQRSASMLGGGNDKGSFFVPATGTELEIRFPTEDIYAGFYVGFWQTPETHNTVFDDGYPDKYGFTDSGFTVSYDNNKNEFIIQHPEGGSITMKPDGSIEVVSESLVKVSGTGGTEVGDSSSVTQIKGSKVILADGGPPVARHGDQVVGQVPQSPAGTNPLVNGTIIATTKKTLAG